MSEGFEKVVETEGSEGTSPANSETAVASSPATPVPPPPLTIHQQLQQILFRFDGKVRLVEPVSGEEWEWDMEKQLSQVFAFAIITAQMTGKMLDFLAMPGSQSLINDGALYKVTKPTK